jgi:hypothetical protein
VNQHTPASDLGSQLRGATDGVGDEAGSKPAPLVVERHTEAGKQRHRLWVPSRAFADP